MLPITLALLIRHGGNHPENLEVFGRLVAIDEARQCILIRQYKPRSVMRAWVNCDRCMNEARESLECAEGDAGGIACVLYTPSSRHIRVHRVGRDFAESLLTGRFVPGPPQPATEEPEP